MTLGPRVHAPANPLRLSTYYSLISEVSERPSAPPINTDINSHPIQSHHRHLSDPPRKMLFSSLIVSALAALSVAQTTPPAPASVAIRNANAQAYIKPGNGGKTPVLVFAVGTSFGATDYKDFAEASAKNDVVTVILNYDTGTFKNDAKFGPSFNNLYWALRSNAASWKSTYNVDLDLSNLWVGGHSAGGRAALAWARSLSAGNATIKGLASWDPVDSKAGAIGAYSLQYPQAILIPSSYAGACGSQINTGNNGASFFRQTTSPAVQLTYTAADVQHNSLSSSGSLGQLVCYKKVAGFPADAGTKLASLVKGGSLDAFVAAFPGNTAAGPLSYAVARK
ncbi:hypothetical protein BC831DRAFT_481610 [Entophlyctis helioformis]|nr:hypothetical protein BC831DRAFT_481610 [Entophlyctis helioformis]